MDFKESYKNEMNWIVRDEKLDEKALEYAKEEKKNWKIKRTLLPVAASICLLVSLCYSDEIRTFADSIYGTYYLIAKDTQMDLGEMKPIVFNKEQFLQDPNTQQNENLYWQLFHTYNALKEVTNIQLPEHEEIEYQENIVSITESGYGHLTIDFIYKEKKYYLNAMFLFEEVDKDGWGYGEENAVREIYKYAENKNAYFVSDSNTQAAYFSIDNILYQFYIENTLESTQIAKEIISLMGE